MRLFKPTYKDKAGKQRKVKKWWVELRDHNRTIRRFPGMTDKETTRLFGDQIQRLINCRATGEQPGANLSLWLAGTPARLRAHFVRIRLLKPGQAVGNKPLNEQLVDFRKSLGDDTTHAKRNYAALMRTFEKCKFIYWSDIQASILWNSLLDLRRTGEISHRTFNFYVKACKQFCSWMVRDQRASSSPVGHLRPKQITVRKIERRAIPVEGLRVLLDATETAPEQLGTTGHQRSLLYRLAVETGLRANELRNLTVSSFDLDERTVECMAVTTKNKKHCILPLRAGMVERLKVEFHNKLPTARAFKVPEKTAKMIRVDLAYARSQWADQVKHNPLAHKRRLKSDFLKADTDEGRLDFHALRHTFCTLLAASGTHPAEAQALMRHSDINLTMGFYTHRVQGAAIAAVNNLPDLSAEKKSGRKNLA